jgi:O-acetylhomoserine (thiol)-lyase
MERHCANALAVAKFLQGHSEVTWVNYPGLPGNKYYELTRKYLPKGASGLLSFGIKDGARAGEKFIEAATFMSHLANIGDAKTLVIHPASTTHRQMSEEEQAKAGVTPDMIRISVGLETLDDILWDIDQSLRAAAKS